MLLSMFLLLLASDAAAITAKGAALNADASQPMLASRGSNGTFPHRLAQASLEDVRKARFLVEKVNAIQATCREVTTTTNRNTYQLRPDRSVLSRTPRLRRTAGGFDFATDEEIADAEALLAESDAVADQAIGSDPVHWNQKTHQAAPFWMAAISRKGSWPFGGNPSNFTVSHYSLRNSSKPARPKKWAL